MNEIIPIACDHAGYELKLKVIEHLRQRGFEVKDFGTDSTDSCDYPDYAHQVGSALNKGVSAAGLGASAALAAPGMGSPILRMDAPV